MIGMAVTMRCMQRGILVGCTFALASSRCSPSLTARGFVSGCILVLLLSSICAEEARRSQLSSAFALQCVLLMGLLFGAVNSSHAVSCSTQLVCSS